MKRRTLAGIIPALALFAACEIPNPSNFAAPNWDMTWDVPVKSSTLSVASFLPKPDVTLNSAGTAFVVAAPVTSATRTFGSDCGCSGTTVGQKPAFTGVLTSSSNLPTTVTTATMATGSAAAVKITNGYGFDPINPPGGAAGSMTIVITNNSVTIGSLTLNGGTNTLPSGVSNFTIPLSGTVVSTSAVTVTTTMTSPAGSAGQPVTLNSSATFAVEATPSVLVSAATVALTSTSLKDSSTFNLKDIDESVRSRVNSATLSMIVTNPFTASGTMTISFFDADTQGALPVTPKQITLASNSTAAAQKITLTKSEISALLGTNVKMKYTGSVTGGAVVVTPSMAVSISSRLQINLNIKGE